MLRHTRTTTCRLTPVASSTRLLLRKDRLARLARQVLLAPRAQVGGRAHKAPRAQVVGSRALLVLLGSLGSLVDPPSMT